MGLQDNPRLCWNAGTIAFEINIASVVRGYLNPMAMVRNADYGEMAYVFQGLLAGIVASEHFPDSYVQMTALRLMLVSFSVMVQLPWGLHTMNNKVGFACSTS